MYVELKSREKRRIYIIVVYIMIVKITSPEPSKQLNRLLLLARWNASATVMFLLSVSA